MLKRKLSSLVILLLLIAVAGCSNNSPAPVKTPTEPGYTVLNKTNINSVGTFPGGQAVDLSVTGGTAKEWAFKYLEDNKGLAGIYLTAQDDHAGTILAFALDPAFVSIRPLLLQAFGVQHIFLSVYETANVAGYEVIYIAGGAGLSQSAIAGGTTAQNVTVTCSNGTYRITGKSDVLKGSFRVVGVTVALSGRDRFAGAATVIDTGGRFSGSVESDGKADAVGVWFPGLGFFEALKPNGCDA